MITLAVDSSHDTLHLALKGKDVHYSISFTIRRRYTEELMNEIELALLKCSLTFKDLDLLVCSKGPGSFTGLRVAMSSIKGISLALGIPYVSVSTLETYAYPLLYAHSPVLVLLDAKKQRYYGAIFDKGERVTADLDLTIEEICNLVTHYDSLILSGPDSIEAKSKIDTIKDKFAIFPHLILDNLQNREYGPALIALGEALYAHSGEDDISSGPTYVRLSDAEVSLIEKINNNKEHKEESHEQK
ncbi:MAG: tRNA (adenosine(37)-N6)-threonylcarbamoyltransferase complex dimerization subunit type 1 TsaB [Spirochaetia bacterium]|nr:tRNA (adenosine(37)-N6)-threonylcarbamoyltransferase complex dimerization subunit type 1 TsaB [Spirochaetia bacterium]